VLQALHEYLLLFWKSYTIPEQKAKCEGDKAPSHSKLGKTYHSL
jgi:hypothetical protein